MKSRYPGTQPFSDSAEDVLRFFGRGMETEELYLRVLSVPLLVQFGRSGLGKTSLLQAGLFPRLRQKPFLPVMIRLNIADESLTAAVERAIRESCASEGIEPSYRSTEGLWELLSSLTVWRDDLLLTPVLVFDQFEEVFTLRDAAFRAEIASELGALASGIPPARAAGTRRPMVKVLISLREDYLGGLEEFSAAIPGLFQERLRLGPLTEEAARDAIEGPAKIEAPDLPPPFELEPAALDLLIAELKGKSGIIEPFQLQLLARHAESVAARKGSGARLTPEDFGGAQDFQSVLKNFYRDTLQRIDARSQRGRAQLLVEEGLLGAAGHRLMLEEGQLMSDYGVTPETLQTLETSRVIRRERRMESVFYEISHDRIADSIFRNRTWRLPRNVRRSLWAAAIVAAVIVAGLVIAHQRVRRERDRSEEFISFLLGEEFLGEVRDIGRLSLLGLVNTNVDANDRAPMNRALAARNAGDLARATGNIQKAMDHFTTAIDVLEREPDDDDLLRERARTHERLVAVLTERGKITEAVQHAYGAVQAWDGVKKESDDCMSLARALVHAADARQRIGHTDQALHDLDRTSQILFDRLFGARGATSCGPPRTAQAFPDGAALDMLSRIVSARATYLDRGADFAAAYDLADHARKLRLTSSDVEEQALISLLMRAAHQETLSAQLRDYREATNGFRDLSRWDPDNLLWQRKAAAARLLLSQSIVGCHVADECNDPTSLHEAEAVALQAITIMRRLSTIDPNNAMWQDDVAWGMATHAAVAIARENPEEALRRLDEAGRIRSALRRDPADWQILFYDAQLDLARALVLELAGDAAGAAQARQSGIESLVRLNAAQPRNLYALQQLIRAHDDPAAAARLQEQRTRVLEKLGEPVPDFDLAAAQQIVQRGNLSELSALETSLRRRIMLRPAESKSYHALRLVYQAMSNAGPRAQRFAALQAAVHAARIAQALQPNDVATAVAAHEATYHFAMFLADEKRIEEARVVMLEAIALADDLAHRPDAEPSFWGLLGKAECGLGTIRVATGRPGWEEALRSGIIHLRLAENDPRFAGALRQCEAYLASKSSGSGTAAATGSRPIGSTRP
jgi:hypothetical protein